MVNVVAQFQVTAILAYLSPGKGLMVHQHGCRNIKGHQARTAYSQSNGIAI